MNLPDMNKARLRTKDLVLTKQFNMNPAYKNLIKDKYYYVKTYGCQMNERDSENICAMLEEMGYKKSKTMKDSDIIILNTCSIRENANNKVFGMIGRIKNIKAQKKDLILGICGCMTQEEHIVNEIMDKYRFIDFVIGTHNLDTLCSHIYNAINGSKLDIDVTSCEGNIIEGMPSVRTSKYKAFVNIQLGCDKFCTYCIVPYTRGKQRSRAPKDILKEVQNLKDLGYQEITFLGQNVNAYGKDLGIDYDLADLLKDASEIGIPRIRFVTSHPWDFTEKLINTIKEYPNIMNQVHLPVQSGSDRILKLMGRRYTKEEYLKLYQTLKKEIPNIAITTDIIVGFPGETEDDFKETLDLVNKCKFDLAYTFIFSKRVGTPAYNMKDETPKEEKHERLKRLNELINKYALINNQVLINQTVKVLVEDISAKNSKLLTGYTESGKLVNLTGPKDIIGKIVDVKITDAKTWSLDGEYVE